MVTVVSGEVGHGYHRQWWGWPWLPSSVVRLAMVTIVSGEVGHGYHRRG